MIRLDLSNQHQLVQALRRLESSLNDWRPFLRRWQRLGHMARIQAKWFKFGGPDSKSAPSGLRRPFLRKTNRNSDNFYHALVAGTSSDPTPLNVAASRPRWAWTKNTMRSTFLTARIAKKQISYDTSRPFRMHQAETYKRFGGPFADEMPDPERVWWIGQIERTFLGQAQKHLTESIVGALPE